MRAATVVIAVILAASALAAEAGPTRRAGEWRSQIDNGPPILTCYPADATFDQAYVMRSMAHMPGAACQVTSMATLGPVTTYSIRCTVNGALMTSSGTITQTGLDSFVSKAHSSATTMHVDGKTIPIPAMDITNTSHRLGPCKPGDRMSKY